MFRMSTPLGFKGHCVVGEENQSQNYNIYSTNKLRNAQRYEKCMTVALERPKMIVSVASLW